MAKLVGSARHRDDRVELDVDVLLGDVIADSSKEYVRFELEGATVNAPRHGLGRARVAMRAFADVQAYVDRAGLHLRWRDGRGGLNFRPQEPERGAAVLVVDLRERREVRSSDRTPIRLGELLAEMALFP